MLGQLGLGVANAKMVGRTTPAKYSSGEAAEALGEAANKRVQKIAPNSTSTLIQLNPTTPGANDTLIDHMTKSNKYASHQRGYDPNDKSKHIGSQVNINPNVSREYLAHELGHHITDQTKVGNLVRNMRDNPKLAIALGAAGSGLGIPMLQSALQEGDDDLASGIAISALMNTPTLVDEALATKNAFAIMEDAGMPATIGQRGRLAGGYLSYMAIPIMSGLAGNLIGNVADDYTAVYNLGNDQTDGTLMP